MLHWLIVFPYYFFGAILTLASLILLCRLFRLRVPAHVLVGTAILGSMLTLALSMGSGLVSLSELRFLPLLILAGTSLVLAALDLVLSRLLPLPLDQELRGL